MKQTRQRWVGVGLRATAGLTVGAMLTLQSGVCLASSFLTPVERRW
jgi:hypothetical protein